MGHVPNINRADKREALSQDAPESEVLGTIQTAPSSDPLPPWELNPRSELQASDARNFVSVPDNWELRWINPKVLDQMGWRYWEPVMASDPRVKVKVNTMVSPEGNIRRGGINGDILGWMLKSWVASRRRQLAEASAKLKQSAVDRQEVLKGEFARGTYGPNMTLTDAKHPTHTIADGRSMKEDL